MSIGLYIDHAGLIVWIFLIFLGIKDLTDKKIKIKWTRYLILLIGIFGIIVDGLLLMFFHLNFDLANLNIFFDNFGPIIFLFLICMSVIDLRNKNIKNKSLRWILLIISFAGFVFDASIVLRTLWLKS